MNRQDATAANVKAGWTDRVKEADRKERGERRKVEKNNSRTKTHSGKKEKVLLTHSHTKTHSQKNKPNLSIFMATDMNSDKNVLSLHFTYTDITENCTFLTTPINWDFTGQAFN